MAKTLNVEAILSDLAAVFVAHGLVNGVVEPGVEAEAPAKGKAKGKKAAAPNKKADKKADKKAARFAELTEQSGSKKGLKALMAACIEAGYDEDEFEDAEPGDFVDALMTEEFGDDWKDGLDTEDASSDDEEDEDEDEEDEEDEDEDDDEDEEEEDEDDEDEAEDEAEEEDEFSREALTKMSVKDLKELATTSEDDGGYGYDSADIKGLNKAALVDLMAGYSEESLGERSLAEIKKIAKNEFDLKVPAGTKKDDLIAQIIEAQEG